MQNHTTNVITESRRCEAQGTIGSSVLDIIRDLRRFGVSGTQPGTRRLIGCEESFAWSAQFLSICCQLSQTLWGLHSHLAESMLNSLAGVTLPPVARNSMA